MKKIILIDDEPLARMLVKEYLEDYREFEIIKECGDGFEGIKCITELKPDLIFLDIQMPKLNGFEMLELLENPPQVIFTTAFDEYALKAFEASAVDYLLKPFSKERFDKSVQKYLSGASVKTGYQDVLEHSTENYPDSSSRIVVKTNGQVRIIPVSEVSYLESYDDYVKIHSGDMYYIKKKTMSFYEKNLDNKQFIRIHRSYLMNIAYLTRIEQTEKDAYIAVLTTGDKLALSRSGYAILKSHLGI